MHGSHTFLTNLAVVLCVAAVTTIVFQRLRQPVVLGYILAGLVVGPHVPIPLVADLGTVETLAELGVILLMFFLGLEFSLRRLLQVGPVAAFITIVQISVMMWLGIEVAQLFGWSTREALFTGAAVAISSTTIIAKAFEDERVTGRVRDLVVGVLIGEDLVAILLLAILPAIASGAGASLGEVGMMVARLGAFLVAVLVAGVFLVPRVMRVVIAINRPETTLVASIGICFAAAVLALQFGYSVALGAFLAGSLIAESGESHTVERLVQPVRDMFAAIFFVAVGMLIDPRLVVEHWVAVLAVTAVVIIGKVGSVALGAFLTGSGIRTAVRAGMSLAQIGEFSFIIVSLGLTLGAVRDFLYPVIVAVSAITTLSTPWLIRYSGPVATLVERKLPRPLQTFAVLYGTWVEQLVAAPRRDTTGSRVRHFVRSLLLDAALLAVVVIAGSLGLDRVAGWLEETLGMSRGVARGAVVAAIIALAAPFCIGIVQLARGLALVLAEVALPRTANGRADLADAPRRVLIVGLQLTILLLVGAPIIAITGPVLPPFRGGLVLALLLAVVGVALWRNVTNLQGHVRAGAEMVLQVLASQGRRQAKPEPDTDLTRVRELLPGLGDVVTATVEEGGFAAGRSLAELNLRGLTGATVLAIVRGEQGVVGPTAAEVLRPGDVLALAGSHESVDAARLLLRSGEQPVEQS